MGDSMGTTVATEGAGGYHRTKTHEVRGIHSSACEPARPTSVLIKISPAQSTPELHGLPHATEVTAAKMMK